MKIYFLILIITVQLLHCSDFINAQTVLNSIEQNMVLVEGGTFMMGQADPNVSCMGCTADEQPIHKVIISSFYICKYEVTQKEWLEIMGTDPNFEAECQTCPIEGVSWKDVQLFLNKINEITGKQYRLPTEAEWEFAARGGKKSQNTSYSGSNNASEVSWFGIKGEQKLHPVGQKKPNELGLYDMSGNVWEWCNDYYASDYYSSSPLENPTGSKTGKDRILRGGSWYNLSFDSRVTARYRFYPSFRTNANGFRLVMPVKK